MMSQHYAVTKVLQFAGVDDVLPTSGAAAPWITRQGWLTPMDKMFAFANSNGFCCDKWHNTWPAAGLLGPFTNVAGPISGGHKLCSSLEAGILEPHIAPVWNDRYTAVWVYMLTGSTDTLEAGGPNATVQGCDCPSHEKP